MEYLHTFSWNWRLSVRKFLVFLTIHYHHQQPLKFPPRARVSCRMWSITEHPEWKVEGILHHGVQVRIGGGFRNKWIVLLSEYRIKLPTAHEACGKLKDQVDLILWNLGIPLISLPVLGNYTVNSFKTIAHYIPPFYFIYYSQGDLCACRWRSVSRVLSTYVHGREFVRLFLKGESEPNYLTVIILS